MSNYQTSKGKNPFWWEYSDIVRRGIHARDEGLDSMILDILFRKHLHILNFRKYILKSIPEGEEGESQEEPKTSSKLWYEGHEGVDISLSLNPHIRWDIVEDEPEVP